jgi:hypothetical protein
MFESQGGERRWLSAKRRGRLTHALDAAISRSMEAQWNRNSGFARARVTFCCRGKFLTKVLLGLVLVLSLSAFTLACGSGTPHPDEVDVTGLPPYTPAEAALFDDSFSPAILDPGEFEPNAAWRTKLRKRLSAASLIALARVSTVTARTDTVASGLVFEVVLTPERVARPSTHRAEPIAVTVPPGSPSHGTLRHQGALLVGRQVVLIARRYAEDGRPTLHFRAEADGDLVRKAVARAMNPSDVGREK